MKKIVHVFLVLLLSEIYGMREVLGGAFFAANYLK